jgi:hypothetical protein
MLRLTLPLVLACCCSGQVRILWKDPGAIERIDFAKAAGGRAQPRPPFRFVSESFDGSSPKILVRDQADVLWRVKAGTEIRAEAFATRFVAALGYYADPVWFVRQGTISGATGLKRAAGFVNSQGKFYEAAFERRDPALRTLSQDWSWSRNPFLATREFQGLKIAMMLLSNWDNKDARDRFRGTNTGIKEQTEGGTQGLLYYVTDWGQTLGGWGNDQKSKSWDCAAFAAQTPSFIQGRAGNTIRFGYVGQHTEFREGITVESARWLMQYLGRISDMQLRAGLKASGASGLDTACFAEQLRRRIDMVRQAAR